MRIFRSSIVLLWCLGPAIHAQDVCDRARQMEARADAWAARALLEASVRQQQESVPYLTCYAEFLDRHNDPKAREVYGKLLALVSGSGASERRAEVARRLVLLGLLAGDRAAAARHLEDYRAAGGEDLGARLPPLPDIDDAAGSYVEIPGPLHSFARMTALSEELRPADLLPALARNVITNGYHSTSDEGLEPTEFLKLAVRYVSQARELQNLADDASKIRIETCESSRTADLLRAIGYRMRGGCGSELVLETVNASRAFLTIDSGFPLADLEQALRTSRPFVYDFTPARAPVLYGAEYWLSGRGKKPGGTFIDAFLADPSLCRLYLAMSKLDRETADALRMTASFERLRAFAHVLDFFGGMFQMRDGRAVTPGGARSAAAWEELAGVSPEKGAVFFDRLIATDDGWLASYFDSLMRIHGPVRDYLTEPQRLKRFYLAIRGRVTSPGPARPVFRSSPELLLLTTRLRLEPDGRPHLPGSLGIWKNLFIDRPNKAYDRSLRSAAAGWDDPDDVLEVLFALCRKSVENEPLRVFLALSDINGSRETPLLPATVDRLARAYEGFASQFSIFAESGSIRDETILTYVDKAEEISRIGNRLLRADVAGAMGGLVGLWQILVRNGSISPADADAALSGIIGGFGDLRNHRELFDSAEAGIKLLLNITGAPRDASPQDWFIDLLAGAAAPSDTEAHRQVVEQMLSIFEAQKLVPLDTILDLAAHLEELAQGAQLNTALVNRLGSRISEIQLPREGLSSVERNSFSFGYWTERHIRRQRGLRLQSEIAKAGGSADKLRELRGELAEILRDTLVGLNYLHYAPPGGQVLLTNPRFVRSHDFLGFRGQQQTWSATAVFAAGWPSSAGGRLTGSLSGLPYALADAEQNFLIPDSEQALIWNDLAPQMVLTAKIPRWWNATASQLQWVALHMRYGEASLAEAVLDPERRGAVMEILSRQALPTRVHEIERFLANGSALGALENVTPSELFALATELLSADTGAPGMLGREIRRLAAEDPERVNYEAISRAFGTPKPTLTNSYRPGLLHLRTFPSLMGYSSRIMAESWESNLLFFADLADQLHMRPAQLNVVVPQWTQRVLETIFATHLEDWPAVLRSLRKVGEDVRAEFRREITAAQQVSLQ